MVAVTRPGEYLFGPKLDRIAIDFALEAKYKQLKRPEPFLTIYRAFPATFPNGQYILLSLTVTDLVTPGSI